MEKVNPANIRIGNCYAEKILQIIGVSMTINGAGKVFHKKTQVQFFNPEGRGVSKFLTPLIGEIAPVPMSPDILNQRMFEPFGKASYSLDSGFVIVEFSRGFKRCVVHFRGGNMFKIKYLHEFQNAFNATFGFDLDARFYNFENKVKPFIL